MNKRHGTHVILGAITPDYDTVDADQLTYPNLRSTLKSNNFFSFIKRSGGDLLSIRPTFKPAAAREDLQVAYLLTAAYRLQRAWTPPEKLFWSSQFTLTSMQLFGRPLSREISRLAADELEYLQQVATEFKTKQDFFEPVLKAYRSLLTGRVKPHTSIESRYGELLVEIRAYFEGTYAGAFACFDSYPSGSSLLPADLVQSFSAALQILQENDPAWVQWKIVQDRSAKLSINVDKKKVIIGKNRSPVSVREARGLFAHEVLVHAQRCVEGGKRSSDLAIGLPNYLDAEEGFGVLVESAISGGIPTKVKDRYIDVALALGSLRRLPLSRQEMFTFCYSRAVIRQVATNEEADLDETEKEVWEHVNRIYRGSLGNRYVGVFTKDVAYYQGFMKIAQYLQKTKKRNNLPQTLQYLLRGKFDPTNKSHRHVIDTLNS